MITKKTKNPLDNGQQAIAKYLIKYLINFIISDNYKLFNFYLVYGILAGDWNE